MWAQFGIKRMSSRLMWGVCMNTEALLSHGLPVGNAEEYNYPDTTFNYQLWSSSTPKKTAKKLQSYDFSKQSSFTFHTSPFYLDFFDYEFPPPSQLQPPQHKGGCKQPKEHFRTLNPCRAFSADSANPLRSRHWHWLHWAVWAPHGLHMCQPASLHRNSSHQELKGHWTYRLVTCGTGVCRHEVSSLADAVSLSPLSL